MSLNLAQKTIMAVMAAMAFLAAATMTFAQTATPSPSPTTTQAMPSGAPNTGLGGGN